MLEEIERSIVIRRSQCLLKVAGLALSILSMTPSESLARPMVTDLALDLLERHDHHLDRIARTLLLAIDGRRSRAQLEGLARMLGLRADALDQLCEAGLIKLDASY
jgi:hypothetical protein